MLAKEPDDTEHGSTANVMMTTAPSGNNDDDNNDHRPHSRDSGDGGKDDNDNNDHRGHCHHQPERLTTAIATTELRRIQKKKPVTNND